MLYYTTEGRNWETILGCMKLGMHEYNFIGVSCGDLALPAVTFGEALEPRDALARRGNGSVDATTERAIVTINLPENSVSRTRLSTGPST